MENKKNIPISLDLQLFAEGGGVSGNSGANATAAVSQKTGENTVSSIGEEATPAAGVNNSFEDRKAKYEAFIKENKDLDDERVQSILKGRLKSSKESAAKLESLSPTLELLAKKYGVKADDIESLNKAIEEDDSYYEQEAFEKGISVEQLKAVRKIEKENAALRKEKDERKRQDAAKETYATWMRQEQEARAVYPSIDLRTELQNPKFAELLKSNIDVKTAYEVIHKDDIIAGAMQYAAQAVEQRIADDIIAGGARPIENGNSSQGAATAKFDPSSMSRAERAEINRRVLRGEKIDLK